MKLFPNSIAHIIMPLTLIKSELDAEIGRIVESQFSLTLSDFKTLLPVAVLSGCTQKDIAYFNYVSQASVSKKVNRLIERGLLSKTHDTQDTRKSNLRLTSKGRLLVMRIQAHLVGRMEEIFSELPKETREELSEGLKSMVQIVVAYSPRQSSLQASKNPILQSLLKN